MSSVEELAPAALQALPARQADVARAIGRSSSTAKRVLEHLAARHLARRGARGVWEPVEPAPDDFDDDSRALYAEVLTYARALEDWHEAMLNTVQRYVRAEQRAREARDALPETAAKRYLTRQSGSVYRHPAIDDERQAERDAANLAKELRMTPDSLQDRGDPKPSGGPSAGDPFDL